ncbi:MAG: disulfide bond formation protein DsbA [Chthoniobacterales bacterium]|nr:MAG: disulfide bond formation protein DsbA [Chthoniobacterales bacterium]
MRRYLPFIIVAAVALITFGGGMMLYRGKRAPNLTPQKDSATPATKEQEGLHARGPATAPVALEEWGDFECPPCGTMAGILQGIEHEYGARLRVIFHQFPLAVHVHAREAALASEAAHAQGRFWEMHDLLYREQHAWSKAPDVPSLFNSYAGMIGLDVERFKKDMQNPETNARVAADQQRGTSRGVSSTPTIFINKIMVPATSLNPAALHAAIEAALKESAPH